MWYSGSSGANDSKKRLSGAPEPQMWVLLMSMILHTAASRGLRCAMHFRKLGKSPIIVTIQIPVVFCRGGQLERACWIAMEKKRGLKGSPYKSLYELTKVCSPKKRVEDCRDCCVHGRRRSACLPTASKVELRWTLFKAFLMSQTTFLIGIQGKYCLEGQCNLLTQS